MQRVAIIGLGYVGLPLTCLCVDKGIDIIGVDIDKEKLDMIKKGISPIDDEYLKENINKIKNKIRLTHNIEEAVKDSIGIVVCVPTPVDKNNFPDLKHLKDSCDLISKSLTKNNFVIIESTIYPGTVEEVILPILKKSGLKEDEIMLAHCPERIDPGNKKFNISNIPRVIGGINKKSLEKAAEFYKKILDAPITELSSVKAAEATKIMENTFRDVNIAFINEMAKSFEKAGIDILEVIKGASSKPFAFMPHYPGVGVGGHCIPVDPYYLIEKAKQIGFNHKFLSLAREINESMPKYTVELLETEIDVNEVMRSVYEGEQLKNIPITNLKKSTKKLAELFNNDVNIQNRWRDNIFLMSFEVLINFLEDKVKHPSIKATFEYKKKIIESIKNVFNKEEKMSYEDLTTLMESFHQSEKIDELCINLCEE